MQERKKGETAVISIRRSRPDKGDKLIAMWCRLVDATYDFLSEAYRRELGEMVHAFLPEAPLWVAANAQDQPIAFIPFTEEHTDVPFADPDVRGYGMGKLLIEHTLSLTPKPTMSVNEQSGQAIGFYQRVGFNATRRSETDDLRQPYPLLGLIYEQQAEAD